VERGSVGIDAARAGGDRARRRPGKHIGRYVLALLVVGAIAAAALRAATLHRRIGSAVDESAHFQGSDVRAPTGTRVRVEVFNATQHRGLGRRAMLYLRDQGFDVVTLGTATALRDTTLVVGRGTHIDWARLVSRALGLARVQAGTDSSRDVDVSVYLGSTWRPPAQPFYP
jgi:LytR cell envelope-related transcriptional attenuator